MLSFISFTDYNLTIILKLHFLSVISGSEEETAVIMAAVLRTIITMDLREGGYHTTHHLDTDTSYQTFTFSAKPEGNKVQLLSLLFSYFTLALMLQASLAARAARCL